MRWISANQLENWARSKIAATGLPGLIGDLIRATAPDLTAIRFPSGDKGEVRGFDGHLESQVPALNVPLGLSYWEFGTNDNYKRKAAEDFQKRSSETDPREQAETTLVLVTPWTWDSSDPKNKLEDWVQQRKSEASWKDVRLLDGVQLEHWLEERPAVAAYHARKTIMCAPPSGVRSTDEFWGDYSNRFSPQLTEDVILCDRETEAELVISALLASGGTTRLNADSADEVVAFAVAAIQKSKPATRLFLEARTLVVDAQEAGRQLLENQNLSLILREDAARAPNQFSGIGPLLVPSGSEQRGGTSVALPRPSSHSMGVAFKSMGMSEEDGTNLARGCGRSLTAVGRRIPGGNAEPPKWLSAGEEVVPALLAGSWDADNDADKLIVAKLVPGGDYSTYERRLRAHARPNDPLVDLEGTVWKLRAPMDAFLHAGHLLGAEHLEMLRPVLTEVFGALPTPTADTVFQTERLPHSSWLRDGLATTMLLLANWTDQAGANLPKGVGQRFVNGVVESLPGLATDHRLIAALKDQLPLLAEAAPDPLLSALERLLGGDGDAIRPIFEESQGRFGGNAQHTGLLWALETLAWDPTLFRRVALILARLAKIDPGGKLTNRPDNSLRGLFRLWHPSTNATLALRLSVLDQLFAETEEIAWSLTVSLIADQRGIALSSARPRMREAGSEKRKPITYGEIWEGERELVDRAIAHAGTGAERWLQLMPAIFQARDDDRIKLVTALRPAMGLAHAADNPRLWENLRELSVKHERFADAQWSLNAEQLAPVKALVEEFEPQDAVARAKLVFDNWLLETADPTVASNERETTLGALLAEHGPESVLDLASSTRQSWKILETLATLEVPGEVWWTLLRRSIARNGVSDFSIGVFGQLSRAEGLAGVMDWLKSADGNDLTALERAKLVTAWPDEIRTWRSVASLGQDVAKQYWLVKNAFWLKGSKVDLLRAIASFLRVGRATSALRVAHDRLPELTLATLEKVLLSVVTQLNQPEHVPDQLIPYEIEKALDDLEGRPDVSTQSLARLEYALYPVIEHGRRAPALFRLMADDPEFYFGLIREVFREDVPEDEEPPERPEPTEAEQGRWRQNYSLLSEFNMLPGMQRDGSLNEVQLRSWVDEVLRLARAESRLPITEQYVGHVLAHSPPDTDGAWPLVAIRNEIERLGSEEIDTGFRIERFNMRGVHWRGLYDGGKDERALADECHRNAEITQRWPRTSAILKTMGDHWIADAEREDNRAALRKLRS